MQLVKRMVTCSAHCAGKPGPPGILATDFLVVGAKCLLSCRPGAPGSARARHVQGTGPAGGAVAPPEG